MSTEPIEPPQEEPDRCPALHTIYVGDQVVTFQCGHHEGHYHPKWSLHSFHVAWIHEASDNRKELPEPTPDDPDRILDRFINGTQGHPVRNRP